MPFPYPLIFFVAIFCLVHYLRKRRNPYANLPWPPGPKPLPIVGNLLDVPKEEVWLTYDKWFKHFRSDIVYINPAGSHVFILNTYQAAVELLEKRSAIYSNRIRLPMLRELMGYDWNIALMPYDDRWRLYRRLFSQEFNAEPAKRFEAQETQAAHRLLLRLIDRPGDVMQHLRHLAGDLVLSIAYGIDILEERDPFVARAEEASLGFSEASQPGAFLVDFLPWLKYIPSWFPGAGFQRKAKKWKKLGEELFQKPFDHAKSLIMNGSFKQSFVSYGLEAMSDTPAGTNADETVIKHVAATMYGAGADTTTSVLGTLIVAVLQYPEVQLRAQRELDSVLKGALPTFAHQSSLPYVTAMVLEALRWQPVIPFGVPHCSTSDDVYNGYRIPVGSMVIANSWSMLRDEEMYPNPDIFNPDRFLKDGQLNPEIRDPRLIAFGFGRRICPGRYMAYSSIWITAASLLAAMRITKATDPYGNVIEPSGEYQGLFIHLPKPFQCNIEPRSMRFEEVLRAAVSNEN